MRVMIDTNVFISALLFPSSQMSELLEKLKYFFIVEQEKRKQVLRRRAFRINSPDS